MFSLSKAAKLVLGLITLAPLGDVIAAQFITHETLESHFTRIFLIHGLVVLAAFALTTFYIVGIYTYLKVPQAKRLRWTLLILLVGVFTMPPFWYWYIWRDGQV